MNLFNRYGFFVFIPALFVVVGIGMFINTIWGLVTGGPRMRNASGAPYLYDRGYYLLFLVAMVGWTVGLLSILTDNGHLSERSFMVGWGILAVSMGSLFGFRSKMMFRGADYLSKHGFWLWRFFHKMQAMQLMRLNSQAIIKPGLIGGLFVVAGIVVLAINVLYIPAAFISATQGAKTLIGLITAP